MPVNVDWAGRHQTGRLVAGMGPTTIRRDTDRGPGRGGTSTARIPSWPRWAQWLIIEGSERIIPDDGWLGAGGKCPPGPGCPGDAWSFRAGRLRREGAVAWQP